MSDEQKLACELEMTRGIIEQFWRKVCERTQARMWQDENFSGSIEEVVTEIIAEMRRQADSEEGR